MNKTYLDNEIKNIDELYAQYNWFSSAFSPLMKESGDEFFSELFDYKLVSLSKNSNILLKGEDYFVTKIRFDKNNEIFFRASESTIKLILERVLGTTEKSSLLSSITELEAKIITSFNEYVCKNISNLLNPNPTIEEEQTNDKINLTFFLKDKKTQESGKYIISIPKNILSPENVFSLNDKFNESDFTTSNVEVNIKLGTTKFHVKDLKNLEKEDLVIFENSNIQLMNLIYKDYETSFRITPNPGLIISLDNTNGGNNMNENSLSQNLWDNIQVEMGAEFDKVKISLGELKSIEQGLVVDISSVYDNKISLKVENKIIAKGELVIINDRYGVKIDEVFASEKAQAEEISELNPEPPENEDAPTPTQEEDSSLEQEFDYSDFELDEQDI